MFVLKSQASNKSNIPFVGTLKVLYELKFTTLFMVSMRIAFMTLNNENNSISQF